MYTKIKRESSEKETQKNLKTLLNIVNNSSCYRCFLGTSGQDLDFFRKLKENTKVNLVWNGNLKKGILGFLLGFIPDRIGIVEFLKPIDEVFFEDTLYDCGPSTVSIVIMKDQDKIQNFIKSFKASPVPDDFEASVLKEPYALIYTIGISDIDDGINLEEIVTMTSFWVDRLIDSHEYIINDNRNIIPIIVIDSGDVSLFADIKDAELYLEPDDVKQNAYEIFNRNGDLLNPIILKKSKKILFGTFVKESIQIMPYIPNINNKEYLLELLFKFCDNVKIEVPKGINLNNLVDRLIKEIGFTK